MIHELFNRLREEINSLTQANKQVNVEYEKKLKEFDIQFADVTKDRENIEIQLEASRKDNKILLDQMSELDQTIDNTKAELLKHQPTNFDVQYGPTNT